MKNSDLKKLVEKIPAGGYIPAQLILKDLLKNDLIEIKNGLFYKKNKNAGGIYLFGAKLQYVSIVAGLDSFTGFKKL